MTEHRTETRPEPAPPADGLHVVIGAGPIGVGIAGLLAAAERSVLVLTRSGEAPGLAATVRTAQADASDAAALTRACEGAAVIYFAAAPPYQHWAHVLPAMFEGAVRAAADTGAVLVVAENLYGYGSAGTLTETQPLRPSSRKGQIRARMSTRMFEAHRAGEIRAVSGRASDFFGPGVRQSQLGEQVWPRLLRGKSLWWLGDPDATHTFTYAPDFARALVRLGSEPRAWGRPWHVPSPPDMTPRQVFAHAAAIAGVEAPAVHHVPRLILRAAGLAVPVVGELPEVAYQFDQEFVMDWNDYRTTFDAEAADWDVALHATIDWWHEKT